MLKPNPNSKQHRKGALPPQPFCQNPSDCNLPTSKGRLEGQTPSAKEVELHQFEAPSLHCWKMLGGAES